MLLVMEGAANSIPSWNYVESSRQSSTSIFHRYERKTLQFIYQTNSHEELRIEINLVRVSCSWSNSSLYRKLPMKIVTLLTAVLHKGLKLLVPSLQQCSGAWEKAPDSLQVSWNQFLCSQIETDWLNLTLISQKYFQESPQLAHWPNWQTFCIQQALNTYPRENKGQRTQSSSEGNQQYSGTVKAISVFEMMKREKNTKR